MELSPVRKWSVAVVATLAMGVSYVDRQAVAVLAQSVKDALRIDHEQFGWIIAAFSIAYLVMAPIAGTIVDRVGARTGLVAAIALWSMVAAAHALVGSFLMLFVLRVALGAAEAPSFPASAQAVRRVLSPRERPIGLGMIFTGSLLGAAVAGPLTIALKARFGWQAAFVGVALVGAAWLPLWLLTTGARPVREALATIEPPVTGATAARRRDLVRDPAVVRAVLLVVIIAPCIMFTLNWLPQYLEKVHGVAENDVGRYVWLPSLAFAFGSIGVGAAAAALDRARARRGDRAPKSHGGLLALAGLLASSLALLPHAPSPGWVVVLSSISLGGGGALYSRLTDDMIARVDAAHVSMAGGLTAAAQSLAYVIANPIVGRIVDRTHEYSGIVVTLGLLNVPGVLLWLVWPMRREK